MTGPLALLRQAKHRAFVATKQARWAAADLRLWFDDRRWARAEERHPYVYREQQYAHTFLARRSPVVDGAAAFAEVPAVLWACWLGGTAPNENRRRALAGLRAQAGLEVRVVTDPAEVRLAEHPFHPAFEYLTALHRSDYLRAYLMHHHGGVYADVKPFRQPLRPVLDLLNADPDHWVVGYREVTSRYTPDLPHELGADIKRHYRAVMGPSGFACRPGTVFTAEWLRELHARLDHYAGALADADAGAADPYQQPRDYPIRWTEILGDIIQPLSLKHHRHVVFTDQIRPVLQGYR